MSAGLEERPAWGALRLHVEEMKKEHMRDMFEKDGQRFDNFSLEFCENLFLDYSKNIINEKTVQLLLQVSLVGKKNKTKQNKTKQKQKKSMV